MTSFLLITATVIIPSQAELIPGSHRFTFQDGSGKAIPVFYTLPERSNPQTPIILVMHGASRTAERYRNEWAAYAQEFKFILAAPHFSKTDFPGKRGYILGNQVDADGNPIPKPQWAFSAINPLFKAIKLETANNSENFRMYGHSGGCQFLHRYLYAYPRAPVDAAVCANAGWYTLPDLHTPYPYGLQDRGISRESLSSLFARRFIVLLGDQDTDSQHPSLNRDRLTLQQGPHRFARGHHFYQRAVLTSTEQKLSLNWSLAIAPGVGHNNKGMARLAAPMLLNGPINIYD
ncbi:MAG: hypothetical protein HOL98_15415 [Gammaproteobacteria bacterium]|nr:hypothetical protein [Gammaproteobacteria bacterium]